MPHLLKNWQACPPAADAESHGVQAGGAVSGDANRQHDDAA